MTVSFPSNQALQASTLIGRSVYVPSGHMIFDDNDTVDVLFFLEESCSDAEIILENAAGEIVYQQSLGSLPNGELQLLFAPLGGDEVNLVNGQYLIRAEANVGNTRQIIPSYIKVVVESVRLAGETYEPILNLKNNRSIALSKVRLIM